MKLTLTNTQAIHYLDHTHFSFEGAVALVEYLEVLEYNEGKEMEFDPIALKCQYSEYSSFVEAYKDLFSEVEINEEDAKNYFWENTSVLTFEGGVIIDSQF
jgi:hypothetical protein